MYRPEKALVFPLPTAFGEDPRRKTAINFVVTGSFSTTNAEERCASRISPSSCNTTTATGEAKKARNYRRQVCTTWKNAF